MEISYLDNGANSARPAGKLQLLYNELDLIHNAVEKLNSRIRTSGDVMLGQRPPSPATPKLPPVELGLIGDFSARIEAIKSSLLELDSSFVRIEQVI